MSDEDAPDAIAKEEGKRYWRETEKQKIIIVREWVYLIISILVAAMLVWALWSWRAANNQAGKINAKIEDKLNKFDQLIEDSHNLIAKATGRLDEIGGSTNDAVIEVKGRLADLAPLERNLAETAATLNRETAATAATARTQMAAIGPAVDQLRTFVAQTGTSINGDPAEARRTGKPSGLLPTATAAISSLAALAPKLGLSVDELNGAIKQAAADTHKDMGAIYDLLARPEIVSILQHSDKTMGHVEEVSASVAEAMKRAPSIAASLDKIATTSSRFTKITLITNIIGTLAKAFLP